MVTIEILQVAVLTGFTMIFQVRIWAVMLESAELHEEARRARATRDAMVLSQIKSEAASAQVAPAGLPPIVSPVGLA